MLIKFYSLKSRDRLELRCLMKTWPLTCRSSFTNQELERSFSFVCETRNWRKGKKPWICHFLCVSVNVCWGWLTAAVSLSSVCDPGPRGSLPQVNPGCCCRRCSCCSCCSCCSWTSWCPPRRFEAFSARRRSTELWSLTGSSPGPWPNTTVCTERWKHRG